MADEKYQEELKKKEFSYRGKSLEELKKMDIREFARLLKSNERRTALRQYDEIQRFVLRANKKIQNKKLIRTHLRHLVIVPKMIGLKIHVYNGKIFSPVEIMGEMLGHRLGEFSVTRTKVKHGSAGVGATRSSASRAVK
ncbi:30S ribosomal protein S19 [Candidatus Pacearchaeota archaeon]|nr:30S ribosomal protein S19 [Candidatus Pacearchaeota archaeon]